MYWYLLSLLPYSDTILTKCIIPQMDYPDLISMFPGCIFSYVRWTESAMAIKCLNIACCKWLIIFSPTAWCHNSAKLCHQLHFASFSHKYRRQFEENILHDCIKVHKTFEELSIPICDETLLQMLCKSKDKWGGKKKKISKEFHCSPICCKNLQFNYVQNTTCFLWFFLILIRLLHDVVQKGLKISYGNIAPFIMIELTHIYILVM